MRNQKQILEQIEVARTRDPFGFEWGEYANFLSWENVKQFLRDDAELTEEQWASHEPHPEYLRQMIRDYLPFAWDKANGARGISANRSLQHFIAWAWLAEDNRVADELIEALYGEGDGETGDYEYYGKPQLVFVSREYGVNWRELDDDEWANGESELGLPADRVLQQRGMGVSDG